MRACQCFQQKSQGLTFYDTFARFNRASAPPPSSVATPSDVSPLFPNTAAGTCFCVISISRMGILLCQQCEVKQGEQRRKARTFLVIFVIQRYFLGVIRGR
jgi:hypothetical protein